MSATTAWYDPAHTISVEYRPITWERIRRLSFDGLMSLPRVGLGVGGFLLGTRDARRIVVTDFSPIECSHASGPSFNPTTEEIAAARSAIKNTPLEVVG